jgi:hypothetical protein
MKFKEKHLLLSIFLLFWCFAGCFEQTADISIPKGYHSNQISFKYPKNWEITQDNYTPAVHNLFVETAGDALVILQSYQSDLAEDLESFSKSFSKSFSESSRTDTPIGEASLGHKFEIIPREAGYEWIREQFEISLLGVSVPHRRIYGTKKIADRQIFLIFQVATEDYSKAEPGFRLIRDTLRESKTN